MPTDDELLTETAIDSFSNMAISDHQHTAICQRIIRYMQSNAPIQLWPNLLKFILNYNHQSGEHLAKVNLEKKCEIHAAFNIVILYIFVTRLLMIYASV